MKKIEGYVSKKAIRFWLENYEYLEAGALIPTDEVRSTGGAQKAEDGKTANELNKIMLDQAIEQLPPLQRACIMARYVKKLKRDRTLKVLEISASIYYERCNMAIEEIHTQINGEKKQYKGLLDKIMGKA